MGSVTLPTRHGCGRRRLILHERLNHQISHLLLRLLLPLQTLQGGQLRRRKERLRLVERRL
jgi:hypothetical protein